MWYEINWELHTCIEVIFYSLRLQKGRLKLWARNKFLLCISFEENQFLSFNMVLPEKQEKIMFIFTEIRKVVTWPSQLHCREYLWWVWIGNLMVLVNSHKTSLIGKFVQGDDQNAIFTEITGNLYYLYLQFEILWF